MISQRLLEAVVCISQECAGRARSLSAYGAGTTAAGPSLRCEYCGSIYSIADGYIDLMPQVEAEHTSLYVAHEEEFADTLDYKAISIPLLGAGVRQRAIRRLLKPAENDRLIELGCGNGKFLYWNRKQAGWAVGIDPAPLFAEEALRSVDLCQADARNLPFVDGTFTSALSIDVLEHLPLDDIKVYLGEAHRVLADGGRILIFSNTREGSRLDFIVRGARILSRRLGEIGLIDNRRDNLRKSDHVKAIATYEELHAVLREAGFNVEKVLFWNGLFQSLIENLVVKIGEAALRKVRNGRAAQTRGTGGNDAVRTTVRGAIARRGIEYRLLRVLTELMWLDLAMFGSWKAGPYFVLARREGSG